MFLRSPVRGGADRSYGVEVARLAGLPGEVVTRARALLASLERDATAGRAMDPSRQPAATQLGLFPADEHPVVARLRGVDPNTITPIQALALLANLVDEARA